MTYEQCKHYIEILRKSLNEDKKRFELDDNAFLIELTLLLEDPMKGQRSPAKSAFKLLSDLLCNDSDENKQVAFFVLCIEICEICFPKKTTDSPTKISYQNGNIFFTPTVQYTSDLNKLSPERWTFFCNALRQTSVAELNIEIYDENIIDERKQELQQIFREKSTTSKVLLASTNFQYLSLNEKTRTATTGGSSYHSFLKFRPSCPDYHRNGFQWSTDKLEQFFSDGLLQHYAATVSPFDFEYNYQQRYEETDVKLFKYEIRKFQRIFNFLGINTHISHEEKHHWLREVIEPLFAEIKSLKLLLKCGAVFQLLKQLGEQHNSLREKLCGGSIKEQRLSIDRQLETIQCFIYNWTRFFCKEVQLFVQAHKSDLNLLKDNVKHFSPSNNPIDSMNIDIEEREKISTLLSELDTILERKDGRYSTLSRAKEELKASSANTHTPQF